MYESKRYWYIQLNVNFFEDERIDWLCEQTNGYAYVVLYLKLCLKTANNNGILTRQIGDMIIPYNIEKIAEITNMNVDIVRVALEIFKKIGLVYEADENCNFMRLPEVPNMVRTITQAAIDKRRQRAESEEKKLPESSYGQIPGQCPENVPDKLQDNLSQEFRVNNKYKIDDNNNINNNINTDKGNYTDKENDILLERGIVKGENENENSRTGTVRVPYDERTAEKEKKQKRKYVKKPFVPPTLQEVEEYCRERNSCVDPKRFYDYFSTPDDEGRTWIDSKGNPVRNWKQKIIVWEGSNQSQKKTSYQEPPRRKSFIEIAEEMDREDGLL